MQCSADEMRSHHDNADEDDNDENEDDEDGGDEGDGDGPSVILSMVVNIRCDTTKTQSTGGFWVVEAWTAMRQGQC